MAASGKMAVFIFAICVYSMINVCVHADSLDDIINEKPAPASVKVTQLPPFSAKTFIDEITDVLDDNGSLKSRGWLPRDIQEKAVDFDKENFGECIDFYLQRGGTASPTYGSEALANTSSFLFSATESEKEIGRSNLKMYLGMLAEPGYRKYSPKSCVGNPKPLENLKELLNTIINAAPAIIDEKRRLAAVHREEDAKKQAKLDEEKQRVQTALLAAERAEEERLAKLTACRETSAYKLYESSALIVLVNSQANSAKLEIKHQEEGAKISGYVDKQVMYKMGNTIAEATRLNQELFASYRKLGGPAKNVESVRELPNPCSK